MMPTGWPALVRRVLNRLGLDIYRLRRTSLAGYTYEPYRPPATYAPWRDDVAFQKVFRRIQGYTFVDEYRCYELWSLVAESAKLEAGALLEVGVWRGGTGGLIAARAQQMGIREPVYLCDTFAGVVKAGPFDQTFYRGGEHADTSAATVRHLLTRILGLDNFLILQGIFPDETSSQIPDSVCFRFAHIDVDTYQSARDATEWLWERLVPGGMIVFDDYGFKYCEGVTRYVQELRARPELMMLHNLNGHAVVIRLV